eukprot:m51a1_g4696 hypothetical protein (636) ;mRNA; f:208665-210639
MRMSDCSTVPHVLDPREPCEAACDIEAGASALLEVLESAGVDNYASILVEGNTTCTTGSNFSAAAELYAAPDGLVRRVLNNGLEYSSGAELSAWRGVAAAVKRSARQLPEFSGIAFRGVVGDCSRIPAVGARVFWRTFLSASTAAGDAESLVASGGVLYEMGLRAKCGSRPARDLAGLAVQGTANEVLVEPNVVFEVVCVCESGSATLVTLSQVPCGSALPREDLISPRTPREDPTLLLRSALASIDSAHYSDARTMLLRAHSIPGRCYRDGGLTCTLALLGLRCSFPELFSELDDPSEPDLQLEATASTPAEREACAAQLASWHQSPASAWLAGLLQSLQPSADISDATGLFRRAASAGCVPAAAALGANLLRGAGIARDPQQASDVLRGPAELGCSLALAAMSKCLRRTHGNPQTIARLAARSAALGSAQGLCALGLCYAHGDGVPRDSSRARSLFARAAALGDAQAQHNVAVLLRDAGSAEQAARWHALAAAQGHAGSQCSLAGMLLAGAGVVRDECEAARLWALAAAQGDARAQCNAGLCLEQGCGVRRDPCAAAEMYRRAAAQGYAAATHRLALCYEEGVGVQRDAARAARLHARARRQGHTDCKPADAAVVYVPEALPTSCVDDMSEDK